MRKHSFYTHYLATAKCLAALGAGWGLAIGPHAGVYAKPFEGVVKRIVVSTDGPRCPIQFVDPYGARVTDSRYVLNHFPYRRDGIGELYLQFECLSSDDAERIKYIVSARYEESTGKWVEDVSWLEPVDQRVTRTFPVHGVHDSGMAMTRDAINGDPETRDREFAFCLRHPPLVLCGTTWRIARPYYKRSDLLPFALTIIKSIEFIDVPNGESTVLTTSEATSVTPSQDGQ